MRRREWIIYTLGSLMGAFCGLVLFIIGSYVWPSRRPPEVPTRVEGWVRVAYTRDVPPDSSKGFAYGKIPGVIIHNRGEMRAFSLLCSHFGCVVNWIPDRKVFSCPCHGGEFNSRGTAIGGPPKDPLHQFAIQIREHGIYVKPAWLT